MFQLFNNLYLILIVVLIVLLYLYNTINHNYWKSRGISGPKPLPVLGNLLEVFYKPLSVIEEERFRKYGRIHGFYDFYKPILSVGEPELIKQIMVKDFNTFINRRKFKVNTTFVKNFLFNLRDDNWKRVRAIASPTFSSGKLKKMFTLIDDCVDSLLKKLDEFAVNGNEVDVKWLFGSYTMNVIAKCAFATDTNALEDKDNPFVKNAYNAINVPLWRNIFYLLMPTFVLDAIKFTIATPDSFEFFRNVAKHVLKERKSNPDSAKYNDFLQLLVDAEKPNNSTLEEMSESPDEMVANVKTFKLNSSEYKKLDEDEIIANIVIFLVAGYETTASLLSFSTYNLALNPETQEKLYEEIKNCKELNYDTVSKLPFLDAVICETLRLQNPVTRVEREANDDCVLGDTGITINRYSIVAIPIHAIHHDPEYFPNPHQFRPERFYGEEKQNIKPYTYLPFGSGPRNCIGMRFALVEAKLALAKIILKFKFVKSTNTQIPLKFSNTRPGLLQAINIIVGVEKRS